jgi:hypothetical protein
MGVGGDWAEEADNRLVLAGHDALVMIGVTGSTEILEVTSN